MPLPHCESFYKALDKRLEQKMTINDIANELCNHTKDPRRNMILDIKEYKGEDWLVANAEWLGYDLGHALAGKQTQEQAKRAAIRRSDDLLQHTQNVCEKEICEKGILTLMLEDAVRKEKDNINEQKGISVWGWLAEDTSFFSVRHLCNILPYMEEGYYFVSIGTVINLDSYRKEEDQKEENLKLIRSWNSCAYKSEMIDLVVDSMFYPQDLIDKLKRFRIGEIKEFPEIPKIKKSQDPGWEWSCHLGDRCKENWFEGMIQKGKGMTKNE